MMGRRVCCYFLFQLVFFFRNRTQYEWGSDVGARVFCVG